MKLLSKEQFSIAEGEIKRLVQATGESNSSGVVLKVDDLASTVCTAIDQAAPRLNIGGGGSSTSSSVVGKQDLIVSQPDVNVAISTLQGFFLKTGISIALCGESHAYKDPAPEQPKLLPGQGEMVQAMLNNDTDGWTQREFTMARKEQQELAGILQEIQQYPAKLDSYRRSQKDCVRAKHLLKNATGGQLFAKVDLIVLERAMKLYTGFYDKSITVTEDDLLGEAWSIRQRSALMAAYIFLCAAGGPSGHVLVMFGEEHKDILDFFEYFATHSKAFTDVSHVQRNFCLIASHV